VTTETWTRPAEPKQCLDLVRAAIHRNDDRVLPARRELAFS